MNDLITKFNQACNQPDLAKLLLRIGFAGLFLFHGVHKIYGGTAFIQGLFTQHGLPAEFAYLVYLGEVIAPLAILIGVWTRLFAFLSVGTCVVVIWLMHTNDFFSLTKVGAWSVEGVATFLFGFLAIMLLGSGKYALKQD